MTTEETKIWNERHFQICLALLSKSPYGYMGSKDLTLKEVISKADRMVRLLQEREQKIILETKS